MFDHSEVKIRLLKLYLERYLNLLNQTKFVDDIYVFDLFSGPGIYGDNGVGSPITILKIIKNIHFANKAKKRKGKFHCLFNDLDESKIEHLKENISSNKLHYPEMGQLKFFSKNYKDLVPAVTQKLGTLKKEKAFIFIDPYGYKDIAVSDIYNLLKCGKSEVLLFLPTQFMFRFRNKGTPEVLKVFIEELLSENEYDSIKNGIDFIESLKKGFRARLGNDHFVDTFIISRDKNQFFALFFFTSHVRGFEKMLEAKWKIDEEEGRGWSNPQENNLFNLFEETPANTKRLEDKLIEFLKVEKTNCELYLFSLKQGFLPKHTKLVLNKFQSSGTLIVSPVNNNKIKKSAYYINYDHFKDNLEKVKIKIK